MGKAIGRMLIVTHAVPEVGSAVLAEVLQVCEEVGVEVVSPENEFGKHPEVLGSSSVATRMQEAAGLQGVDLCLVLGGDGTMLRAFHLTRGSSVPVAGVNLGRVGFLTTVAREDLQAGLRRLVARDYRVYPLLGLEAALGGRTYQATNDVVVHRGGRPTACSLGLNINGVRLFEVQCDGVVVATPAGSSAYSLAAGGPLLGVSLDAYVISLVAAHAVGVRPVVAAPVDVLEITNLDHQGCHLDVDGQRTAELDAGGTVEIHTVPAATSLALLEGDSLYKHFRDRLL